jgi:hypothetical protein
MRVNEYHVEDGMDTLKFALALEGEGMEPAHAKIIAHELYAIYAHSVLGGVYKSVDYGDFKELQLKARLVREYKEATNNVYRAMLAKDDEAGKRWNEKRNQIDAEQRARGFLK